MGNTYYKLKRHNVSYNTSVICGIYPEIHFHIDTSACNFTPVIHSTRLDESKTRNLCRILPQNAMKFFH